MFPQCRLSRKMGRMLLLVDVNFFKKPNLSICSLNCDSHLLPNTNIHRNTSFECTWLWDLSSHSSSFHLSLGDDSTSHNLFHFLPSWSRLSLQNKPCKFFTLRLIFSTGSWETVCYSCHVQRSICQSDSKNLQFDNHFYLKLYC